MIGGGKVGSIIALSLRECGADVRVTARSRETLERLRGLGLDASNCNKCVATWADYIFLAVKPYQFPLVAQEIRDHVNGKTIISVMAAISTRVLSEALPGAEIHRTMPNLNIRIRRSLTALYSPPGAAHSEKVREMLSCFGEVYEVPEDLMDAWTAVAGSGPAIVAEFLDAFFLASLAVGLPRGIARSLVVKLIETTAQYLSAHSDLHPAELRDEVTTPAGTTIAAIGILEGRGFKSAVIEAVRAATRRAGEIEKEIERKLLAQA